MRIQSHEPHAIRRRVDWRAIAGRLGAILAIGGGMVAVSTPELGGIVFGAGLILLIGACAE